MLHKNSGPPPLKTLPFYMLLLQTITRGEAPRGGDDGLAGRGWCGTAVYRSIDPMRTEKCWRSLAIVPLMALGFLLASLSVGYSLSLSKLLGVGQEPEYNTFRLIHVADLKSL